MSLSSGLDYERRLFHSLFATVQLFSCLVLSVIEPFGTIEGPKGRNDCFC